MCGPVVICDASCFRFLTSATARQGLNRQLAFTEGFTVGTAINAIEISRQKNPAIRARLRDTLRFLAGERALLPWPYGLLEAVGTALMAGAPGFTLKPSGLEHLMHEDPTDAVLARADHFVDEMTRQFDTMHDDARPQLQQFVKERRLRGNWDGARAFLDEMWMKPSHIDTYIERVWKATGLPDGCPVDEVRDNPSWRVFFEGNGVAAYEQAILPNRAKRFGIMDLLQLVYATGFPNGSIFVTNDKALARAGEIVVSEVVPGARVMLWDEYSEF